MAITWSEIGFDKQLSALKEYAEDYNYEEFSIGSILEFIESSFNLNEIRIDTFGRVYSYDCVHTLFDELMAYPSDASNIMVTAKLSYPNAGEGAKDLAELNQRLIDGNYWFFEGELVKMIDSFE